MPRKGFQRVAGPTPGGLFGQGWKDVRYWANERRKRPIVTRIKKELREFGDEILALFAHHIKTQDLGWKALHKSTIAYKRKHGYPELIYYSRGEYLKKIHRKVSDLGNYRMLLRVYPIGFHYHARMPMVELAGLLEKGSDTKNIPARPLWQPVTDEIPTTEGYKTFMRMIEKINFQ